MCLFRRVFKRSRLPLPRAAPLLGLLLLLQGGNLSLMGQGQFGRTEQHFAQVVLNGGSTTSFSLHNPSTTETILVRIQIFDASGGALVYQQVELEPRETKNVPFGDPDQPLTRGWAKLTSEGEFLATAFFQLSIGGELKHRIGVPPSLTGEGGQGALAVLDETTLIVDPQESVAAFLNEEKLFGLDLTNYEGTVEVDSTFPIAMLSLTQEASGGVATVFVETPRPTGPGVVSFGTGNTRGGTGALLNNTTGSDNTVFGVDALRNNTTGDGNSAGGHGALRSNTTGHFNTAIGNLALLYNTTGGDNTASGVNALSSNTTGTRNTAIGFQALYSNTTGAKNIAIGYRAGQYLQLDDNIAIGNDGSGIDTGVVRIGTSGTHTKTFVAGIRGVTTGVADAISVMIDSAGQLGTVSSSRRFKEEIRDMGDSTDRLLQLRAVLFRYKQEVAGQDRPLQYGLIAEEVAEIFPELVVLDEEGKPYTVRYHLLSSMLLNELQKLQARAEAQDKRVEAQVRELEELRARLEVIESRAPPGSSGF